MKKISKKWTLALATAGLATALLVALDGRLRVETYRLTSPKLTQNVWIALLSDLHSCNYGEEQRTLLELVIAQSPDAVLLAGDIVDDEPRMDPEWAYAAVAALAQRWPTYYVTGNHEIWGGDADAVCRRMAACGVVVLRGAVASLELEGQTITVSGVDDPAVGEENWNTQLETVDRESEGFSILLTHRPERVERYQLTAFDLVVAGHAHGGQWRLPGLINGLMAPDQGFFPDYAGGYYPLGGPTLVVSRGLARESTLVPRLFNRPEVTMLELSPPNTGKSQDF